jgi:ribonuclease BN (tRNA processing enzyme)
MKVTFAGTRGSVPVSGLEQTEFGGNTTSIEILSECLPENMHLIVDAGSGIVPLSMDIMKRQGDKIFKDGGVTVVVAFTHLHHDHTQGLFLSPLTFIKQVRMHLIGPSEHGIGPCEMMKAMMKPPFFPVPFENVGSHFAFRRLKHPSKDMIIFHPTGGMKILSVEQFEKMERKGGHVPVGRKGGKYPISECLVIRMYKTHHPEQTISYRFEERPTGKVFVLLTDHENLDGVPVDLRKHVEGADLLVLDAQYDTEKYKTRTAGFGHGTGAYCAGLAHSCGVERLGLTHHDPFSSDEHVKEILTEARGTLIGLSSGQESESLSEEDIFACSDGLTVEV